MCDVDFTKLKALLGCYFYTAVFKSSYENIRSLFASDGNRKYNFHCIMNKNIFSVLISMLRFDNPNDRDGRGKSECAAPISQVFKKFVSNCRAV
jgi:hypothetical protein